MVYLKMAMRDSKEIIKQKHIVLKVLGGFFVLFSIIVAWSGFSVLTTITFPKESIGAVVSPYKVIHSTKDTLYWGYPTRIQSYCFNSMINIFNFTAWGIYCFFYKSSHKKWVAKLGKLAFCVLFFVFYSSATDFHYFDFFEWISPVGYVIMAWYILKKGNKLETQIISLSKKEPIEQPKEEIKEDVDINDSTTIESENNPNHIIPAQELFTSQFPISITNNQIEAQSYNKDMVYSDQKESNNVLFESELTSKQMKYCRQCGGRINYDIDKYCKYCGTLISDN